MLDRSVAIMLAAAHGPLTLNELCENTALPRATVHRLATALEAHRILARTPEGKWTSGSALPGAREQLIAVAAPIMEKLRDHTGESVQLYQLTGATRTCVASREPASGLHNVVPVGRQLPLSSGSAARVIAAYAPTPGGGEFFSPEQLELVRQHRLAESVEEREAGLASVSAPIINELGHFVAALSISGSSQRLGPSPREKFGAVLSRAAEELSAAL